MIKAVIFDMDGLIADTESLNSQAWEKLLAKRGIKPIFTKQGLIHEVGPVNKEGYIAIMERHKIKDDFEIIKMERRKFFEELVKEKLVLFPGFLELVKELKMRKVKLAIASNRVIEHVYLVLDKLKVKDLFNSIVGPNPSLKRKPAPDIYLQTAKELKLKPEECLVLEDSETGVISAKAAGMKVIAIPNKYTLHQNFSKADKIVESLNQVNLELINSL